MSRLGDLRTRIVLALAPCALALLAGCAHVPVDRHSGADPDRHLADILADLDAARAAGRNNGAIMADERVIVDSGAVRARLEQLALEYPRHAPTLLACAQLAFEAGEFERAQSFADRVLQLQPDNVFAGILRARVALHDGNLALARRTLERQLTMAPDSPYLYEVLAGVYFLDGDMANTDQALRRAEALGGEEWRIAYHRGLLAERKGQQAEALRLFQRSAELNPDFYPAAAHATALESGVAPTHGSK